MKIIVTGGAGFIGNHVCRLLISQGHKVTCIDNFYSGRLQNISDINNNKNFDILNIDITSKNFPQILESIGYVDQIYHLACPASPKYYQKTPLHTIKTCVHGTMAILDYAKKCGSSVLLTSTSEIYGEPLEHPQVEEYRGNVNTLGIRACYDESKRLAETIMMEYHRLYNVNVKIVRIFNTYGPGMSPDDGRVVTNFITQALENKDITIYGDGSQTRSFCYIDDMVLGLVSMMNSHKSITGPFNIGNPIENTVKDLAELIIKITESKSSIVYKELPEDDPTRRCPNILKITKTVGWLPIVHLEEGLQKTVEYIKNV